MSQPALSRPMVGDDPSMRRIRAIVGKAAPTDSSVLVLGESGTGKALIARAIHEMSGRRGKAWVPVDCGAIPADLLERELFGYVEGAFAGATADRAGRLEMAEGGTSFLDEVDALSLPLQVKLLRVLQARAFEPVGGIRTLHMDVRVVAATHQNLERAVAEGRFREDLYYRLSVVEVHLPALRDRCSDVALLIEFFNARQRQTRGRSVSGFTDDAMRRLVAYRWPGNVSELANVVERLTVFCDGERVETADLPSRILENRRIAVDLPLDLPDGGLSLKQLLSDIEARLIRQALLRTGWNKNRASALLRMNRTTLVEKLKKRGMLDPPEA